MKKLVSLIELILYYIIGFLIFALVVSIVEFVFVLCLSNGAESLFELVVLNFKKCIRVYTIIFTIMYILNLIYSFISIKMLNQKLKQIK